MAGSGVKRRVGGAGTSPFLTTDDLEQPMAATKVGRIVIPANAGIQRHYAAFLDPRVRGDDGPDDLIGN
jgi:hypothetical protein